MAYVEGGVVLGVPLDLVVDSLAVYDLAVEPRRRQDPAAVLMVLDRQLLLVAAVRYLRDVTVRR